MFLTRTNRSKSAPKQVHFNDSSTHNITTELQQTSQNNIQMSPPPAIPIKHNSFNNVSPIIHERGRTKQSPIFERPKSPKQKGEIKQTVLRFWAEITQEARLWNIEKKFHELMKERDINENIRHDMTTTAHALAWEMHIIRLDDIDLSPVTDNIQFYFKPQQMWCTQTNQYIGFGSSSYKLIPGCKYILTNDDKYTSFVMCDKMFIFSYIETYILQNLFDFPDKYKDFLKPAMLRQQKNNITSLIPGSNHFDFNQYKDKIITSQCQICQSSQIMVNTDIIEKIMKELYPCTVDAPQKYKTFIEACQYYKQTVTQQQGNSSPQAASITQQALQKLYNIRLAEYEQSVLNTEVVFFANRITGEKTWKYVPGVMNAALVGTKKSETTEDLKVTPPPITEVISADKNSADWYAPIRLDDPILKPSIADQCIGDVVDAVSGLQEKLRKAYEEIDRMKLQTEHFSVKETEYKRLNELYEERLNKIERHIGIKDGGQL